MTRPGAITQAGRFDEHVVTSDALRGNPLGDPHERPLWVYVPPGYDDEPDRRYPSIYVIQGYTGQLDMWRNRPRSARRRSRSSPTTCSRPATCRRRSSCGSTRGRSSAARSSSTRRRSGSYHTYLCDELVPFVDERYRTIADAAHRGIQGKSSGGYGAMVTPMLRPDLFGGFATHAGDALFEACYAKDFPETARLLRDKLRRRRTRSFWNDFLARPLVTKSGDFVLVNTWGMAAAYSADDDGTVRLPIDDTGKLIPEVWERWLRWDPVRMVDAARRRAARHAGDLHRRREERRVLPRPRRRSVSPRARAIGVTDVFFELFEGKHGGIVWRYPIALGISPSG